MPADQFFIDGRHKIIKFQRYLLIIVGVTFICYIFMLKFNTKTIDLPILKVAII
jgi:hypothetical protein